uniref:Ycf59 n=1 Tax=Haramonas pauciplastida TaxID=478668 RepID=UPI002115963A|nr:Ycf59 [Haramonas pauciplastida]UTE94928.1 Ycf59 [Haramonas pauciplastida]
MANSIINKKQVLTKTPTKETLLTPRFYTTDFEQMADIDISSNTGEVEAILAEFRADYNQQHFIRDSEFVTNLEKFDKPTKALFIEFLERSCTAEFSGFLLYKELSRNLRYKNPLLAEGFSFMARDEARHAGFLNKAMSDFDLSLDLGFLTKSRRYTFFAPKFILYATYLSEKIGYWRYITIYRHLEKNPKYRAYPIFRFFESWCQDENRHGDFFAAVLKAQPELLSGWTSNLWCKFFLLSVFVTMYLNDAQRESFYSTIGLDARKFDIYVIKKTNQSSGRLFPLMLDVDNPLFFMYLEQTCARNLELVELGKSGGNELNKFVKITQISFLLLKLFSLKSINTTEDWKRTF